MKTHTHTGKQETPPLRQIDGWRPANRETDKLGSTWRDTHDEMRQVKAQKRYPEGPTPLDSVGEKRKEKSEEAHPKSRTPPARLGNQSGRQAKQASGHHQPDRESNTWRQVLVTPGPDGETNEFGNK